MQEHTILMVWTETQVIRIIGECFPWWGNCHFKIDRLSSTLLIEASDVRKRHRILRELKNVNPADMNLKAVVLRQPNYPDKTIRSADTSTSEITMDSLKAS